MRGDLLIDEFDQAEKAFARQGLPSLVKPGENAS
jgi:hypothetical protein